MTSDVFLFEILKIHEKLATEEITAQKMIEWLTMKGIEIFDLTD